MAETTFGNQNPLLTSPSSSLKFLLLEPKPRVVKLCRGKSHWVLTIVKFYFSVAFFSEIPEARVRALTVADPTSLTVAFTQQSTVPEEERTGKQVASRSGEDFFIHNVHALQLSVFHLHH